MSKRKARFKVGQRVMISLLSRLGVQTVERVLDRGDGFYSYRINPDTRWWAEGDLRPLTARERGPRKRGKR